MNPVGPKDLAFLYVEKHMTIEMTPAELYDFYKKTLEEMKARALQVNGPSISF